MLCLVDRCTASRHDRSIPVVIDVEALIWAENWKPRAIVAREKGLAWRSSLLEKITEFIVSHRPFGPTVSRRTAHFMLFPLSPLSFPLIGRDCVYKSADTIIPILTFTSVVGRKKGNVRGMLKLTMRLRLYSLCCVWKFRKRILHKYKY